VQAKSLAGLVRKLADTQQNSLNTSFLIASLTSWKTVLTLTGAS